MTAFLTKQTLPAYEVIDLAKKSVTICLYLSQTSLAPGNRNPRTMY